MKTFKTISALAALLQPAVANLDVVTLFAKVDAYIQEASATLVLGDVPLSNNGDVALWSAIMMQNEASFLQGVTQNSPEGLGYCSNLGNKWCNFAYALIGKYIDLPTYPARVPVLTRRFKAPRPKTAPLSRQPPDPESRLTVGDKVRTVIEHPANLPFDKLNSKTQMWDQNLYIDDELVSTVSTSKGEHGEIFYISIECAAGTCSTAPAHSWEDVSIVLSTADASFGQTGGWDQGATGGDMSTPDGGKTWEFTTLEIPATDVQH
ncbi:hypothetical protein BFJ69_g12207 [Fusarium oxysporum]|uniref:Uncharacterized protein n=1 Tax=Fusarium oxysporum TaxID=5507 RepID=A0A420MPU4_FUSOX|nr:hypothetical protein BFJ69_g12207 [Fusarium oxysporum]